MTYIIAHFTQNVNGYFCIKKSQSYLRFLFDSYAGGVYEIRTRRLFHAMEALYQMS